MSSSDTAAAEYRPRRSVLYMPGANARALEKAKELPCDSVIFDLEDAVAPEAKAAARQQVADAVRNGGYGAREVVVRINGADTPWHGDDVAMVSATRPGAVLVPKVERARDIEHFAIDSLPVWAMIETPRAILEVGDIAATRVAVLCMGLNDLAKDLRAPISKDRAPLQTALQMTLLAARAEGKVALDGVYNDIADEDGFAAECAEGRALGFDGKTLIHPSQIEGANAAYSPSAEEVRRAQAIVAAFAANPNAGVLKVEGQLAERLHLEEARRIVAISEGGRHAG